MLSFMDIKKLFDRACNDAGSVVPSRDVTVVADYLHDCVPLRDVLTGIFNGSPIPPDYLGEPHEDTDDTPITEIDPLGNFGYSKLDREQYVMDVSAQRVDNEGHRARSARARTAPRDGKLTTSAAPADAGAAPKDSDAK